MGETGAERETERETETTATETEIAKEGKTCSVSKENAMAETAFMCVRRLSFCHYLTFNFQLNSFTHGFLLSVYVLSVTLKLSFSSAVVFAIPSLSFVVVLFHMKQRKKEP